MGKSVASVADFDEQECSIYAGLNPQTHAFKSRLRQHANP